VSEPWPVEIRLLKSEKALEIQFDDGKTYRLPAELLRVETPSAEAKGHGGPRQIVTGKENVAIREIEPVGNYAIRILFDDGHDTGIYSWRFLRALGDARGLAGGARK
jgi:DUF971 family protein